MLPEYLAKEHDRLLVLRVDDGSSRTVIRQMIAERRAKLAEEVELGLTIRSPMIPIRLLAEIELLRGELE